MDTHNFPTKKNLLLAIQRLALARKGYYLLDKKRQVLLMELRAIKGQADEASINLQEVLSSAHKALSTAEKEMGKERVHGIIKGLPKEWDVEIDFHSIMGGEITMIKEQKTEGRKKIPYKLDNTTISLDEAVLAWKKARELIISWAAIENSIYRLNIHIRKTQKRANALGNITIPKYEARIKYISERLEERERDELARLKLAMKSTRLYKPSLH